jgi:hypothetical protein
LVVAFLSGACASLVEGAERSRDLALDERVPCLVAAYDLLGAAFGLAPRERRAYAARRRAATNRALESELDAELDRELRVYRPWLRIVVSGAHAASANDGGLGRYASRVADAAAGLTPEGRVQLLQTLLHLDAVRMFGPDRAAELRAYTFWERTLESLERHPERAPRG